MALIGRRPSDMYDGIDSASDSEDEAAGGRSARSVPELPSSPGLTSPGPPLPSPVLPSLLADSSPRPLADSVPVSLLVKRSSSSSVDSSPPSCNFTLAESATSSKQRRLASYVVEVPAPYPGLQYRQSKDLADRLKRYARDQATVHGIVEDFGQWLHMPDGTYLPIQVGGKH